MISTLVMALALQAQAREYHCDDPQNQHDMNACAAIDFEAADAELNAAWAAAIAGAREMDAEINREYDQAPTSEAVLREAQRAWIAFRDAHCALEGYAMRGGSAEPLLYNGCRARITEQRTGQLRALILDR